MKHIYSNRFSHTVNQTMRISKLALLQALLLCINNNVHSFLIVSNKNFHVRNNLSFLRSSNLHDYIRDPRDGTNSLTNQKEIDVLLGERISCKKRRMYSEADDIRDVLKEEYGVYVDDRSLTYYTDTSLANNSHFKGFRTDDRGGGRNSGGRRQRDFGPRGHDYNQAPGTDMVTELSKSDIDKMLAKRLQAKLNRDYRTADEIQEILFQKNVVVHDGKKLWRGDGITFGDDASEFGPKPGRERGSRADRNRPYVMSSLSDPISTEDKAIVEQMIEQRVRAKQDRDFDIADQIRETLLEEFNIKIEDRLRAWSVGGHFEEGIVGGNDKKSKTFEPFRQATTSDKISDEDKTIVEELVEERSEAKKIRDFRTADAIRDRLISDFNVAIDDRERLWSVGGDFGFGKRLTRDSYEYAGDKSSLTISEKALAMIEDLLQRRSDAKKNRDFDEADAIREKLRNLAKIEIDDRSRVWFFDQDKESDDNDDVDDNNDVDDNIPYTTEDDDANYVNLTEKSPEFISNLDAYKKAEGTPTLDEEEYVISRLQRMLQAEQDGDYSTGYAIRSELKMLYNVEIDDNTGYWFVSSDSRSNTLIASTDPTSNSEENEPSEESLKKYTVPELKEKLRNAGLPVSGKKSELIERLMTS